jgi:DNA-binding protein HU-beta
MATNGHRFVYGRELVNKAELIDALADRLGEKKSATVALDAVLAEIQATVTKGDKVSITGFGVFEKRTRAARMARNPRTGEAVKVKKTAVPAFRPGAGFKEMVATGKAPKAVAPAKKSVVKKAVVKSTAVKTTAVKTTAAAKKTSPATAAAKKTAPAKTAARKTTPAKTAPAKTAPAKKAAVKKAAVKTTAAKTTVAAKSTAAKKAPAKTVAKKAPAKKAAR